MEFLKGYVKQRCTQAWKCANILFACFVYGCKFDQYSCNRSSFLFQVWAPHSKAMLVCSLAMKSRKRLADEVMYTHAGFVQDVTDTDHQTQNGSTHSHVSVTFQHEFLTNLTINWHTHTHTHKKLLWAFFFYTPLLLTGPVMRHHLVSPLIRKCWQGLLRNSMTLHCRSGANSQHWSTTSFL